VQKIHADCAIDLVIRVERAHEVSDAHRWLAVERAIAPPKQEPPREFQICDDGLIGQLANDIVRFKRAAIGQSTAKGCHTRS
jgi:hypothetical protein